MTACSHTYDAHYRWEWFRRNQWRASFRERKRHSSGAFIELVREREWENDPVLDCSCALGLKTIVMREAGLSVSGSDVCEEAVRLARRLGEEEGHPDIRYFVSFWADLPRNTDTRYAAVFNDVLSWIYSEDEMALSLKGIYECLRPGGILAYMGASPGSCDHCKAILEQEWQKRAGNGPHWLGFSAEADGASVREVVFVEKGSDFIDEHHLYLVNDASGERVENWCLRCSSKWEWPSIQPFLEEAGFVEFGIKEFVAANGKPFHLVVATRD